MPSQILNLTGQIGSKSIEIDASWIHWDDTQFDQGGIQCNLSEFPPNLTSISCPVEFNRLNLTGGIEFDPPPQIGWKSLGWYPIRLGRHTNVISVNLHPFLPLFHAQSNSTGGDRIWSPPQIGWKSLGWYPILLGRHTNVISVNLHPFLPLFHAR